MLLVPTEAWSQTGRRSAVIVAEGENRFLPVDVEIGIETGGRTEIRKGLEAGQKVVVSSQFLIDSEASLKGTPTPMGERPVSEGGNPGRPPPPPPANSTPTRTTAATPSPPP